MATFMDGFLEPQEKKKGINKGFIVGAIFGILIISAGIWLLTRQPSMEDQMANVLEGSYREGSPEFGEITKDIIISTSENTVESPNAFGKISMFISGTIRNKGNRVINGLEVNVAVVTQFNDVLKEKRVLVVPTQRSQLGPGEIIPITLSLDGFDRKDDRANIRWKVTAIRVAN
jgi:putative SOS response-associated peptidase YedK